MAFTVANGAPQFVGEVTLDPSNIPAFNASVETFTPSALALVPKETVVLVEALSLEAGVVLEASRMTATGTLELTFRNNTNAAINPASQTFKVLAF